MADKQHTYFISYSRADTAFAQRLAEDLDDKSIDAWWDQMDLSGGSRQDQVIVETLEQCAGIIVVLSKTSVASKSVADEWSYALDHGKPVFTVKIEECDVPMRTRCRCSFTFCKAKSACPAMKSAPSPMPPETPSSRSSSGRTRRSTPERAWCGFRP